MFLFVSDKNSQLCNKSAILPCADTLTTTLINLYPNVQLKPLRGDQFALFSHDFEQGSSAASNNINIAANIEPLADLGFGELDFANKNILLGILGGERFCSENYKSPKKCTILGEIASNLIDNFEQSPTSAFTDLPQQYVLFSWCEEKSAIKVLKDPFNPKPVYWTRLKTGFFVSTCIQAVALVRGEELVLSEAGLASWLSGYPNPAIPMFEHVGVLPIGYELNVGDDFTPVLNKVWDIDPNYKIRHQSQSGYTQDFLDTLTASVDASLLSEANTVVSQMSGGMDSTSITAIANQQLKAQHKTVLPLSHLYTQSEKCDEQVLVDDMLRHLNLSQSIKLVVDEGQDRNFFKLYPVALDSPGTVLSPRYLKELGLVRDAGADVMLSGNGGDEMCWGHSLTYTQRFKQGDWQVVNEVLKACPSLGVARRRAVMDLFIKPSIPEWLAKAVGLKQRSGQSFVAPVWVTDKAVTLAQDTSSIDNPFDPKLDPVGYNRYLSIKTTSTYNAMRSYDKLSEQFDISVRHPFFDPHLAEFSFAIPPEQLIRGAYPKWLLRTSMQGRLPDSVCWNLQKTTFDQHFGNLVRENAAELRVMLNNQRLADMGLVNQTLLLKEFDNLVNNPSVPLKVDLLYAILTFCWVHTHFS